MINAEFIAWFDDFGRRYWSLFLPVICLLAWWFHYGLFKRQLKSALFRFRHRQIAGITRRRQLQESEERLRIILSSILTGVAVVDPRNRQIEFVNPAACKLLGGNKKEILGRRIEDFELVIEELVGDDPGFSLLDDHPKQRHLITLQGDSLPVLENTSSITIHGAPFLLKSYLDLSDIARARQKVEKLHSNLTKRVQELHCLFGVTALMAQPGLSRQELLQRIVNLVPLAMRRPHYAVARIVLADCSVSSETFVQTAWSLRRPIFIADAQVGSVDVCYVKDPNVLQEDVFEREEISLVETLAQRLGHHFDSLKADEEYALLSQVLGLCPVALMVIALEDGYSIHFVNGMAAEMLGMRHEDLVGHRFDEIFVMDDDLATIPTASPLSLVLCQADHSPAAVKAQLQRIKTALGKYVALYLVNG